MNYKERLVSKNLLELSKRFPIVVVTGAKRVGKSTLVTHIFPDWDIVVFDPYEDIENARKDPDLFLVSHKNNLILDEIQYAPEVIPVQSHTE